jgi:hypothetical protein
MAVQDVREFVPRVRRAIEGPQQIVPPGQAAPTDDQLLALAADSIADIILLTAGQWPHKLTVSGRDPNTNFPNAWGVDPGLELEEESVIAAQAGITFFFHQFRDQKMSETIKNEGQEWQYQLSATLMRDQVKLLVDMRDAALAALRRRHPVLARYQSILAVRDRVGAAIMEPYTIYGAGFEVELGGGQERGGNVWLPAP